MSLSTELYEPAMLAVGPSSRRGDTDVWTLATGVATWSYGGLEARCGRGDTEA